MKGGTNMLFERIHASGVGLTIGSLGKGHSSNITFRDSVMHHTYKGIYMSVSPPLAPHPSSHRPCLCRGLVWKDERRILTWLLHFALTVHVP